MFIPSLETNNIVSFKLSIAVPNESQYVVSSSSPPNIQPILKKYNFVFPPTTIRSYFLGFAIGYFNVIDLITQNGTTIEVYLSADTSFDETNFVIGAVTFYDAFFESKIQVHQIVLIPGYPQSGNATTGVLFLDQDLFVDFTQENKKYVLKQIAMYMILTINNSNAYWYLEGIADFVSTIYFKQLFPEVADPFFEKFLFVIQNDTLFNGLLLNDSSLIELDEDNEIPELSIKKSTCLVKMIHDLIGEGDFKKGILEFLSDQKSFEESFDASTNKFIDSWASQPGYPLLVLDNECVLHQMRFSTSSTFSQQKWAIPLEIWKYSSGNVSKERILMETESIEIDCQNCDCVIINPKCKILCRVLYQSRWLSPIMDHWEDLEVEDKIMMKMNLTNYAQMGIIQKAVLNNQKLNEIDIPKKFQRIYPLIRGSKSPILRFAEF
ncbi:puromycin-sensitive aminopeptidase [Histomonas meleagridis]|uniref:puromycin-sensitive aminopeptidase n=1 Tax=Histomonas meleagridis TaxID=135588 RepID=UPI003559E9A4|nr:puromycin-sensitive aminopeptidase [Histomonas meleagridis]KAH0799119.1 puromycin-sensitive aminopeptidase [Histomonas meleagridis]